jgi:hypothetical protein
MRPFMYPIVANRCKLPLLVELLTLCGFLAACSLGTAAGTSNTNGDH